MPPPPVIVEVPQPPTIDQLVDAAIARHPSVSREQLYGTLYAESHFENVQSDVIAADGAREESYGVCQINLPSHPEVSKDEAMDPAFCIEWTAAQFAAGNASMWTEWRLLYGNEKSRP